MKNIICTITLGLLFSMTTFAATLDIDMWSDTTLLRNNSGSLLTGGSASDGDGTVIQLGYYTGAGFTGSWVALTGAGGLNSDFSTTSMGDMWGASGNGVFYDKFTFDTTDSGANQGLAGATGLQLAIRFYSGTTISGSSHYNTVTSTAWVFVPPTDGGSGMLLDMNNNLLQPLTWESGGANAFKTTIVNPAAIPEPTTYALLGMGLLGLVAYRRK